MPALPAFSDILVADIDGTRSKTSSSRTDSPRRMLDKYQAVCLCRIQSNVEFR